MSIPMDNAITGCILCREEDWHAVGIWHTDSKTRLKMPPFKKYKAIGYGLCLKCAGGDHDPKKGMAIEEAILRVINYPHEQRTT
jgi:hypothetical protein